MEIISLLHGQLVHTQWHIYQLHKWLLPTCAGTSTLEKVGIEYPSIAGKKEHLTSKSLYFVIFNQW